MKHLVAIVIAAAAFVPERPAHADDGDKGTVRLVVEGAVARTRRKIALGPMIGVGASFMPGSDGGFDVPITFGIGLDLFKIPVMPTAADIQSIILSTVKARVAATVEDMIARGESPPSPSELRGITEEIIAQVKDRYLGDKPKGKLIEKPQLAITLEEAYLPSAGAWMTRFTFGFGISKFTIGPSITGSLGDVKGLYLGGELAVHLTPKRGARSPVIDVFFRADWGATSGTRDDDLLTLGTRVMLDLI